MALDRIAAAIDPSSASEDAAVLATAIADATDADLILMAIEPELPLMLPGGNWRRMRRETQTLLSRVRDSHAPGARLAIDTDLSAPRGLRRLARSAHRQLLVVGSSACGPVGEVSIGPNSRQLIDYLDCALAIAPRELRLAGPLELRRIGVGFDGGEEALAALASAATLAAGGGAELIVRTVVDDRIPPLGWPQLWKQSFVVAWEQVMDEQARALSAQLQGAAADLDIAYTEQIERGRAADSLRELSADVDLLVIGSRRWGLMARLLLGGTGEALVNGAHCSLLIVPRGQAQRSSPST